MKPLKLFENVDDVKKKILPIFEGIGSVKINNLISAIKSRQYISFYYTDKTGDNTSGPRFGEPYVLGSRTNKKGKNITYLRMYVVADTSKDSTVTNKISRHRSVSQKSTSNKITGYAKDSGWRLFIIDDDYISNLYLAGKKFSQYRTGYNDSGDKFLSNITTQLSKGDFPKGENTDTNL